MYVQARFILYTERFDVEEFTQASGVDPDHATSPTVVPIGPGMQKRWGLWELHSGLPETEMPDDHMTDLFSRLRASKEGLLRARELADACELMCSVHYEDESWGVPGVALDTDQIALLAELRAIFTVGISIREAEEGHDDKAGGQSDAASENADSSGPLPG